MHDTELKRCLLNSKEERMNTVESYNGQTESILKHYTDATEPKNTIAELKNTPEGLKLIN